MGSRPNERLDIRNRAAEVATSRDISDSDCAAPGMWWTRQSDPCWLGTFSRAGLARWGEDFSANSQNDE